MSVFDNYECEGQSSIYDFLGGKPQKYKITKPIRLIELFAGIGAQAKALERLGANFEHWKISEWDIYSCASYHQIHMSEDITDYSKKLSKKEIEKYLLSKGFSTDGKTQGNLKGRGEKWLRTVYNDYQATHNLGSIVNVKGKDLEIKNTDRFTYLLTYSFPCQDLSVAGKKKGMRKGTNTRSGLLWEVERILHELDELPEVLIMENVTQVHGVKFGADFDDWCKSLEALGYVNFWQDLNSRHYGIAQNRDRTFMVSILGKNLVYSFPKPFPLTKCVNDYLEPKVDERFYNVSERAQALIERLTEDETIENISKFGNKNSNYKPFDNAISYPLTSQDFIRTGFLNISPTLSARDYKDAKIITEKVNE